MAMASCSVKIIRRGKGLFDRDRSAVATSAYYAGETIHSAYERKTYDYTCRKMGIIHKEILAHLHSPTWVYHRARLWNEVERNENRKDSQLARSIRFALPCELTHEQHIVLARAYAQTFVDEGMIVDLSVHDGESGNPYAYLLLTMRKLNENGTFGQKCREWDQREKVKEWRKRYQDITNEHLKMGGLDVQIDVRSYKDQGIDRIPLIGLTYIEWDKDKRGIRTERGKRNREIRALNQQNREGKAALTSP